jgi:signal transduction histidine kinase
MKAVFTFFILVFSIGTNAQKQGQAFIDSLVAEIPKPKSDTLQIRLLNKIGINYLAVKPAAAFQYAEMGLQLATKIKWDRGISVFHILLGDIYSSEERRGEALKEYTIALNIQTKIHDTFNICISQNNIGVVHQHNGNYTGAIDYFTRTVNLSVKFDNSYLTALGYANIATVYFDQANYKKALEYLKLSLALREKDEDTEKIAVTYQQMGDVYLKQKDTANASIYFSKSLHIFEQTENKEGLALAYGNLASLSNASLSEKIRLLLKAQLIWDTTFPKHPNALNNRGVLGETFLLLAKTHPTKIIQSGNVSLTGKSTFLQQAEKYLKEGIRLSKDANGVNNYAYLNSVLAAVEEEQGEYKNALAHFKTFFTVSDSIYSQENKNAIAKIESQKEIDVKDKALQLNQLTISYQQRTQVGLITGLCLLAIIGMLLYWQNRTRKKTNTTLLQLNNDLDEANKIKARFFAILSHDFRGPLSRLVHFLHLQKEDANLWTTDQAALHQKKITVAAESLLENMEDMLAWSKGQMENFKPIIQTVEVKSLFEYLDSFFVTREQVQIIFNDPGSITLNTDENYLQTIMHNLTSNAIKALKQTSNATIIWSARQEGGKVLLSITDNGPGISAEQVKVLNDDTASLSIKTGLGFHLIRDLAKAIRCSVYLQPKEGQGTSFILSI